MYIAVFKDVKHKHADAVHNFVVVFITDSLENLFFTDKLKVHKPSFMIIELL